MDFEVFLSKIHAIKNVPLQGKMSHLKMAPLERAIMLENIDLESITPKKAAVMMLFYPKNGQTHLVLIVRNSFGIHSSQIAFPGGKFEISDPNFEATALRETYEEIGIAPAQIQVIKTFSQVYIPPSNFMVYPFLGIAKNNLTFTLQESEVAGIVEMPLENLMDDCNLSLQKITTSYAKFVDVPAFKIKNHLVWGATAMMLSELKDALKVVF